jgi:hypothetical protein
LVPFPREIQLQAGGFSFAQSPALAVSATNIEFWGRLLNDELSRAGLPAVPVRPLKSATPAFRLSSQTGAVTPWTGMAPSEEGYLLAVRPRDISCAAATPAGLLHGMHTLRQLIRANLRSNAVPCLQVRDWPALSWRGFQDDLTRGPSSTLDTLKFEAELASYLKLNLMTYYMEYQFAFKKHPKIGPPDGSLTPEELSALVAHAQPLHLSVLGNQQSFGHFGRILRHPEYAPLRETAEVLTPVREETYALLDDLYSEVCPVLPFPWFNVCCDETEGLGTGPSRELVATLGVGGSRSRPPAAAGGGSRSGAARKFPLIRERAAGHIDRAPRL